MTWLTPRGGDSRQGVIALTFGAILCFMSSVSGNEPGAGEEVHEAVRQAIKLTREEKYAEAGLIFDEHLQKLSSGNLEDKRLMVSAFSYYGLCVARDRRRFSQALEYCRISLKYNQLDPDHRYNLAMVCLERGDRKAAVDALNAGLALRQDHTNINMIFDEIGQRNKPVIPFLSRANPVNVFLGKKIRKGE